MTQADYETELLAGGLLQRIDNPVARWMRGRPYLFYIPTEFVFDKPQLAVPMQGRYWRIDCFMYEGVIIPYAQLCRLPDFAGTCNYTQVCLYEVWEHFGDDGHTDPQLMYWTLTPGPTDAPLNLWRLVEEGELDAREA